MADAIAESVADVQLEPMPIAPEDILSGSPRATGKVLYADAENGTCSGVWRCTPGEFQWAYDANETVCIIEGAATVRSDDGTTVELRAGSYGLFRRGTRARWTVTQTVLKVFALH